MSSLSFLLSPALQPFALALGFVAALALLEAVMLLVGLSLLGVGAEAEADLDAGAEAGADVGADMEVEFDGPDADGAAEPSGASGGASDALLSWLGLGSVPFAIWLAGVLTAFGTVGYLLQFGIAQVFGAPLGAWPAAAIAVLPGFALGGRVAKAIGRLIPKTETTAISTRAYGGRRGIITIGTARRGAPAEARFRDGHGNTHYALVEPLRDDDALEQGTEIAILREKKDGRLLAMRLDDDPADGRAP